MSDSPPVPPAFDRRAAAFAASALVAAALAFVFIPDAVAIPLVSRAGFWLVLLGFAGFVYGLSRTFAGSFRGWRSRPFDGISVAVVALGGTVLLVHEEFGFKIVMDEIMLLGTSMSMHLDKTVLTPIRGNDIQGSFVILDGLMDKRPLFFPFLVSLLHDLTGYRPENSFVLNVLLTFVFLGLVCGLGRKVAGRIGGWIAVVLFAGLPLLAHNATGGGFELLNLVMLLGTLLLGLRYLEQRDDAAQTAFVYSALLLTQVRYESAVFLLGVAAIVLRVWWCERRIRVAWPVAVAPLLLVHVPLQHRIFDLRSSAWELASRPEAGAPFSLGYVPENLAHAANFFFAQASEQPNSLVFSALGWIALPFFLLVLLRRVRQLGGESPAFVGLVLFSVGFVVQFGLLMGYFWGKFDDVVIRRLSLPTHLGLAIALLVVLAQLGRPAVLRVVLGLAVFGLVTRGVPSMAAHAYSQEYLPGKETAWRRAFIAAQTRNDYLMIDNDSPLWVAHRISATPVLQAQRRRDAVVFHLKNRTFSDVFVFQRLTVDPATGRMSYRSGDDLGPEFVLETVREERLQTLTVSRISRVKEIREDGVSLTAATGPEPAVPADPAQVEAARRAYLENFIKQLP